MVGVESVVECLVSAGMYRLSNSGAAECEIESFMASYVRRWIQEMGMLNAEDVGKVKCRGNVCCFMWFVSQSFVEVAEK